MTVLGKNMYRSLRIQNFFGKGFADIVYLPKAEYSKSVPALIIELNFNKSASKALEQIKERNYLDKVREYSSKVMMLNQRNTSA